MHTHNTSSLLLNLICLLLILVSGNRVFARHIVGGEMTYECTNPGQYVVNMTMYLDCASGGGDFDSNGSLTTPGTVTVYQGDMMFIRTIPLERPTIERIDLGSNPCHLVSVDTCIERGLYSFELDLPISDETYTIAYQRCCRVNNLSNIISSGEIGMTFFVQINAFAQQECSNSPDIVNLPTPNLCNNQDLFINQLAIINHPNAKIKYSLCPSIIGGGLAGLSGILSEIQAPNGLAPNPDLPPPYANVSYLLPTYQFDNPIIANPSLKINPTTGQITGHPTATGSYAVAVCIQAFINDTLLSEIQREMTYNIINCEPQSSTIIDSAFAIGTVINGVVINQDTTFTLVFENPNDGCDSFVTYNVEAISGVENKLLQPFTIYPNPFKEEININSPTFYIEYITIYNNQGQVVSRITKNGSENYSIPTSHLNAGLYVIEIHSPGQQHISRLIKL